jgi:hypothetical protein
MSDLHPVGRLPILAGIGAAALVASFDAPLVRAQALDRPPSSTGEARTSLPGS